MFSVFFSVTQYAISFILMVAEGNYRLLWSIFLCCGLLALAMYAACYSADRKRFPALYTRD